MMCDSLYTNLYPKSFLKGIPKPQTRAHSWGMCVHAPCMRALTLSMHARTCVCVSMLRVFPAHFLYQNHPSCQGFTRLGPKSTLGLRVMLSLGNGGSSHKGYKMRCLYQEMVCIIRLTPRGIQTLGHPRPRKSMPMRYPTMNTIK